MSLTSLRTINNKPKPINYYHYYYYLRTGEMPPALSEGLPHPVTVTMEPTAGVSPDAGRQEAEM